MKILTSKNIKILLNKIGEKSEESPRNYSIDKKTHTHKGKVGFSLDSIERSTE